MCSQSAVVEECAGNTVSAFFIDPPFKTPTSAPPQTALVNDQETQLLTFRAVFCAARILHRVKKYFDRALGALGPKSSLASKITIGLSFGLGTVGFVGLPRRKHYGLIGSKSIP
jgi:hypothetical protein